MRILFYSLRIFDIFEICSQVQSPRYICVITGFWRALFLQTVFSTIPGIPLLRIPKAKVIRIQRCVKRMMVSAMLVHQFYCNLLKKVIDILSFRFSLQCRKMLTWNCKVLQDFKVEYKLKVFFLKSVCVWDRM